jgi:hypothetical protein
LHTIVINAIQNTLNKAVTAGDLTQQQASNILQQVQSHPQLLNKLLNAHLGKGPKGQNIPSQQSI